MPDFTSRDDTQVDLRRVGSNPDHWYPMAWSRELKAGKTYANGIADQTTWRAIMKAV